MKKILMILDTHFPPDDRVEKEALSLISRGMDVSILTKNKNNKKKFEIYKDIKVYRIKYSIISIIIDNLFFFITNIFPIWHIHIRKLIKKNKYKILHVHDLRQLKTSLYFKRKNPELTIISDLHEYYSKQSKTLSAETTKGKIFSKLLRLINLKKLENNTLRKTDYIITVIDEAKRSYLKDYNLNEKKIFIIKNTIPKTYYTQKTKFRKKYDLVHFGNINSERGINILINTMVKYNFYPKTLLIGPHNEYVNKLLNRHKLNNIDITGWVDIKNIEQWMHQGKIALICHHKTDFTDNTIPNKLFHYMAAGLPILSSNCKPIERIIDESKNGLVYKWNNKEELFEKLQMMLDSNKNIYKKWRKNSLKMFKNKYNWEEDEKELFRLYKEII